MASTRSSDTATPRRVIQSGDADDADGGDGPPADSGLEHGGFA